MTEMIDIFIWALWFWAGAFFGAFYVSWQIASLDRHVGKFSGEFRP